MSNQSKLEELQDNINYSDEENLDEGLDEEDLDEKMEIDESNLES